ncbi:MAG: TetR/AcrR family transcriptional regulator [Thermonemataceae bacterium]
MRVTKEKTEQTRQQLLEAATIVFGKKGYTATKLEEIATEAGVTRGAISWHFQNKQNIFRAVVKEGRLQTLRFIKDYLNSDLDPESKIAGFIQYLVKDRKRKHYQVTILGKLRDEAPPEFEDLIKQITTTQKEIIASLQTTIEEGITTGIFAKQCDAVLSAKSIYVFFGGFFTSQPEMYEEYDETRLIAFLTQFINRLLQTESAP